MPRNPSNNFLLVEETAGYQTSSDPTNSNKQLLKAGSQNVLIDYQKKCGPRGGYTRLGDANDDLTEIRNGWTWETSTGSKLPQRFYAQTLEAYITTLDEQEINDWVAIYTAFSATKMLRADTVFDATENIDLEILVNGDDKQYEFSGAFAYIESVGANSVTKAGSTTFAENRFYATRDLVFTNIRTGVDYTYTAGAGSDTLTGISDTTGLIPGDIIVQKVVIETTTPTSGRQNDTIFSFENQIILGSEKDEKVYGSHNDDHTDFAFSAPREAGEGFVLTLTDSTRAINSLGSLLVIFSGRSSIFKVQFEQLTVGTSIAETVQVKKLDTGIDQGALNHECVIPVGNALAYLSNEVALRVINNPEDLTGIDPSTLSNPIKPDFDAEDWEGAKGTWFKNVLLFSTKNTSRTYMLNYIEDADGKLSRFWNPPQILPINAFSTIDVGLGQELYGHSNAVPETYKLFDGLSDGQYEGMPVEEKLPIHAIAERVYNDYGKRAVYKSFDEFYSEGEIISNTTELGVTLKYEFEGSTQIIERTIDGSDEDILEGEVGFNSLAQRSLATQPLAGFLNTPPNARRYRVVFEVAKEDFHQIGIRYESNGVDLFWRVTADGTNATLSPRKNTRIRK